MSSTIREVLQLEVAKRAAWIMNDCHTFFRVRHDKLKWYQESGVTSSRPMGGGNFLMLMGQMNVIGLLAKVYLHLAQPDEFATEVDARGVREAKKEISAKLPQLKAVVRGDRTEWKPPRVNDCNEEKAFRGLIAAIAGKFDFGITPSDAISVWRQFRNHLTHMVWPEGSVAVYQLPCHSADAEAQIGKSHPPFRRLQDPKIWQCNVDRLNFVIPDVVAWLCEEIRACPYDERIQAAISWMGIDNLLAEANVSQ